MIVPVEEGAAMSAQNENALTSSQVDIPDSKMAVIRSILQSYSLSPTADDLYLEDGEIRLAMSISPEQFVKIGMVSHHNKVGNYTKKVGN